MSLVIEYSYEHVPTVKEFSESNAFIRGLMGPFGSGKSSGCVAEIIKRGMAQKPGPDGIRRSRWAVVRNTYKQLEDTSIRTFLSWLPQTYFGKYTSDHNYIINKFPGAEIEVWFRALDRPDQVDNLLSAEYTGAWVNEAREVPWTIIKALKGRVNRYPAIKDGGATWAGVFMDTNPPDADSWWYHLFEEQGAGLFQEGEDGLAGRIAIFKQPSGLSPEAENLPNLAPTYYRDLCIGVDQEWIKVYVKGEYGFVIDGKAVYPEYNDNLHCQPCQPMKGRTIYRGWDFGLTPSCVFTQLTTNGRWLVLDEKNATSMGADKFSDEVKIHSNERFPGYQFEDYGDPAGNTPSQADEKTCFQILRAKNIDIQSGEQTPTLRIESVSSRLRMLVDGKPALQVDPRCKMIRKGFQGGYQFRRMQTAKEKYADKPDKNQYSHPHDALQYVATKLFARNLTAPKWGKDQPKVDTRYVV